MFNFYKNEIRMRAYITLKRFSKADLFFMGVWFWQTEKKLYQTCNKLYQTNIFDFLFGETCFMFAKTCSMFGKTSCLFGVNILSFNNKQAPLST